MKQLANIQDSIKQNEARCESNVLELIRLYPTYQRSYSSYSDTLLNKNLSIPLYLSDAVYRIVLSLSWIETLSSTPLTSLTAEQVTSR